MRLPTIPQPKTAHLSAAPLLLAYLAIPLAEIVLRLSGVESSTRELRLEPGDAAWMLAAAFGTAYFAWRKGVGMAREPQGGLMESLSVAAVAGVLSAAAYMFVRARVDVIQDMLAWLGEVAPLGYLALAVLWVVSFGLPPTKYIRWFGAVLGLIVLADAVGASLEAGRLVYDGGWLFPPDSVHGERHGCLLAVALFATLDRDGRKGGGWPDLPTLCIMLGLLAGFSRTALFAAGWTYLFLDKGKLAARLGFALTCVACIAVPLLMPVQLISAKEAHIFVVWMAGLETMNLNPGLLLTGLGPGPFDLHLPVDEALAMGMESLTLSAMSVGPCWLRMTLAWGLAAPLLLLGAGIAGLAMRPARLAAGIIALCLVQGVVWPLLFDPGAAVIVFLGLFAAMMSYVPEKEDA